MANLFPPSVSVNENIVEVGRRLTFSSMISVSDLDAGSAVTKYRVRDNNNRAESGYFVINDIRRQAGLWVNFTAAQLSRSYYKAALIPDNESFSVQVYDGKFWSNIDQGQIFTVRENRTAPVVTATNGSILATEVLDVRTLFDVTDAEDNAPVMYRFVDRAHNSNGGFFLNDGVRQTSAKWFTVGAPDLSKVRYIGAKSQQAENIGIRVYDGKFWSSVKDFRVNTLANVYKPNVTALNLKTGINRIIPARNLFSASDRDGNTIKKVGLRDSGEATNSGYIAINGTRQAADQWIEFAYDKLPTVTYRSPGINSSEVFSVRVYDGTKWSNVKSNTISTITRPKLEVPDNDFEIDSFERIALSSVINKGDPGPDYTRFQIYAENTDSNSGEIWLNGSQLQNGQTHTLTAGEWETVEFQGSTNDDARVLDPVLTRSFNGLYWTDWSRINVNTDPVGVKSLEAGKWFSDVNEAGKQVITYTFIDGFNNNSTPPRPPLPFYYADDDPEADNPYPLNNLQRDAVRSAFEFIESFANVDFVEVPFDINASLAEFLFGSADLPDDVGAWAKSIGGTGFGTKPGDVWFNRQAGFDPLTNFNVGLGSPFLSTAYHEIGHVMGMKHPFNPEPTLPLSVDFDHNTLMSYTGHPAYQRSATMMLWDVQYIQSQYGANHDSVANDHYFYETNHMRTLWDGGGIDTLNYSRHVTDENMDLREGQFSSARGNPFAIRIAYGNPMENARGGRANDTIRGNEIRNRIWGNEGSDTIIGGGGNDLLRGGEQNDTYQFTIGDGRDIIKEDKKGGVDILEYRIPTGQLDSLEDDFVARRLGNNLRLDLTLDRGNGQHTVVIHDMVSAASKVEKLRLFGSDGVQIGGDIELNSIFLQATSKATRFEVTDNFGTYGFLATPV